MSEKQEVQPQVGKMLGQLIEHQQHFSVMPTEDREWVIRNTPSAISFFAEAVKNRKLLQFLFLFSARAVNKFVAKDNFVEGKTVNDVSIAWLGEDFKNIFLGKIEKNVEAAELKVHKLFKAARSLSKEDESGIIPKLDGKHEIKLAHFFQLLAYKQQIKDFTAWVVGYILDENGNLSAVYAYWSGGGWCVDVYSIKASRRWETGTRFVSL
ncbi:MAG: hypothetical protein NTY93_01370 [Candidatus Kaiserbacteria bacterium]|nr:hypothetical protein [Candidatus Kaiserbacteria bacterium]